MPLRLFAVLACLTLAALAQTAPSTSGPEPLPQLDVSPAALELHRGAIVLDTHIDTTQRLMNPEWDFFQRHPHPTPGSRAGNHVDYERMREGGLNAAFFSIYMPGSIRGPQAVQRALEQIDAVRGLTERRPAGMALCTTAAEVRRAVAQGKIAVLMGVEGGHIIGNSLPVLRSFARLGVRYLTLSHGINTEWSDSATDTPQHNGLTEFGREVVRELNRLGVMVDISHVSDKTFWDALEVSQAPLIASHSSARALSNHQRNLSDEMIRAMAAKGGVVQINFLTAYLSEELRLAQEAIRPQLQARQAELEKLYPGPENAATRRAEMAASRARFPLPAVGWEKILEHIDHVVKLVGPRHVGLGSDFDGATMPQGMEDATRLPRLTQALLQRGYTPEDVRAILGENMLRVMEETERVAARLQAEQAARAAAR